jgi:hypothetical protein
MAQLADLVGKTLSHIHMEGDTEIVFTTTCGRTFHMFHSQDYSEAVYVESVVGDLQDLVGSPILLAEESTSGENPPGVQMELQDSFTWTFYKLATAKGYVDIRWYGESNGYYSESVDFTENGESTWSR